jgi:hypothetical protein
VELVPDDELVVDFEPEDFFAAVASALESVR